MLGLTSFSSFNCIYSLKYIHVYLFLYKVCRGIDGIKYIFILLGREKKTSYILLLLSINKYIYC